MRKKDERMQGTLLECARGLLAERGPGAVNMREIASRAGVATGTVYNYYASKEDILMALTEDYWHKTLEELHSLPREGCFAEQVEAVYQFLCRQLAGRGGLLMSSLGRAESAARRRMQAMQKGLWNEIHSRLVDDVGIREALWNPVFSPERTTDFVLVNLVAALRSGAEDISYLAEVLRRLLYDEN